MTKFKIAKLGAFPCLSAGTGFCATAGALPPVFWWQKTGGAEKTTGAMIRIFSFSPYSYLL
jgi:hypothetical protein